MARTLTRPALYEADHVAWLEEQAPLLRAQRFDELDADNIAEELEGTARSDRRELFNRLAVLLRHLLKRQHQASRRTRSWDLTIAEQRSRLRRLLKERARACGTGWRAWWRRPMTRRFAWRRLKPVWPLGRFPSRSLIPPRR